MTPIMYACDNCNADLVKILMSVPELKIPEDINWDDLQVASALLSSESFQPTLEQAVRTQFYQFVSRIY